MKAIKEYINDYFTIIKEGATWKDRMILFIYFLGIPRRMIMRTLKKEYKPLLMSDVTIKNKDGIFFCGSSFLVAQVAISTYEPENQKYFNLEKGVFIDIGANIGKYAVMQARKMHGGEVIAIEPTPKDFKILKKNISLNGLNNVIPIKVACSDKKGVSNFWLGAEGEGTAHSLFEIKNKSKKILVKTNTLDNIIENLKIRRVDLMKVDVEGAEPNVFRGSKEILKKYHPIIVFEALSENKLKECKKELLKFNYKIKRLSKRDFVAE